MPHPVVSPWLILPFALLLGAIAIMPLAAHAWWERHYPKVALTLGSVTLVWYLGVMREFHRPLETAHEYVSFICLIGSLFMVSAGIHIRVKGEATPAVNVLLLAIGGVLANVVGTTGASMLLIRPFLRVNKYRLTAHHVVFFIFVVSNVGGSLTPIGDPPLYLGYIKGIPFFWTMRALVAPWLVGMGWLLLVFYIIDRRNFLRAPIEVRERETARETWSFDGLRNLAWLGVILAALFVQRPLLLRESIMLLAAFMSWKTTPRSVYEANNFSWAPIREVVILFAGIFAAMMPALDWLEANARGLGIESVGTFYWGAGLLSAVLDNAPTYLNFLSAAIGLFVEPGVLQSPGHAPIAALLASHPRHIAAISIGAVFFGACTYIGNGPNFMVKSIAEHWGAKMPGFLGYVFKFTLPILLPMLTLVGWLFFR